MENSINNKNFLSDPSAFIFRRKNTNTRPNTNKMPHEINIYFIIPSFYQKSLPVGRQAWLDDVRTCLEAKNHQLGDSLKFI